MPTKYGAWQLPDTLDNLLEYRANCTDHIFQNPTEKHEIKYTKTQGG